MKKKKINYFKLFSLFFAIAVLVLITGCSGTPPSVPIINSFSAAPSTITVGESSTLSWSVTDATTVTIDHGVGTVALSGSTTVSPITTTTYTLTATNTAGSVTATTTVTVTVGSAFTVTYDGNGNTGGTVPVDPSSPYQSGATVTVLNKGALVKTGYTFTGWNTQADGSGLDQAAGSTFIMGTSDVTLYAQWTPRYALRDTGPAGGLIFYVKEGGYSDGWMYLEAAPSDQSTFAEWGCYGASISGADGTAVGTGEQNTLAIEAGCATAGTAADVCANLTIIYGMYGYDDWFLPSKDELNLMYENLEVAGVGGFTGDSYWSSSEDDADAAWNQDFSFGGQYSSVKVSAYRVRAVRAF
jgi:uncharacterized repeat protein (TIGR02543 family)